MAANVSVIEYNGSSGSPTATSVSSGNSRFCTADVSTPVPNTDYPLVKPGTGATNYSYKKSYFLNAVTAPTGTINNVKWYTLGSYPTGWTGVTLQVKTASGNSYSQATGSPGVSGNQMSPAGSSAIAYTSVSPLTVGGSITGTTGKISDFVELQATLTDTVSAGTLATMTIYWSYDEF